MLLYSPNGHKSQILVRPNPGVRNFTQFPYEDGGDLGSKPPSAANPGDLARNWM